MQGAGQGRGWYMPWMRLDEACAEGLLFFVLFLVISQEV